MERLSDTAIDIINDLHTERLDYSSEYLPLIDAANKLKEYEDAEEQRLLLRLPCKVGDKVWLNDSYFGNLCKGFVFKMEFIKNKLIIKLSANSSLIVNEFYKVVTADDFGKIVFHTREEAEQALKGGADK